MNDTSSNYVNMGEIKIESSPEKLICLGIGSCIAVVFYEPSHQIGGLAHVMLPDSRGNANLTTPGKFADTAIQELLKKMKAKGAKQQKIQAKIFGGANMFPNAAIKRLPIGENNIAAVMCELEKYAIPLIAKDVGGSAGRTIIFETENGEVKVRMAKAKMEKIY